MTETQQPKQRFRLSKASRALIEKVRATGDMKNPLTQQVARATLDDAVAAMYRAWCIQKPVEVKLVFTEIDAGGDSQRPKADQT